MPAAGTYPIAEFGELLLRYPFVAMMPQWDFLNFLAREAARFAPFNLIMEAEAKSVIEEDGRIAGLRIDTAGGPIEVRADLTIAADGRRSILREQAGLAVAEVGAPMDVLWFRLVREQTDPEDVAGFLGAGKALIAINRGDYWQCGLIIPKGAFGAIQAAGIEAFRAEIEAMAPPFRGRMAAVADWNDVKLLTVAVDRLVQWYRPGFLCIGDAAHAMSPIGGVGINLAIQDAVAASNLCAIPLREGAAHGGAIAQRAAPARTAGAADPATASLHPAARAAPDSARRTPECRICAAEDERVDVVRALIGVHGFQIRDVTHHVIFFGDAVAAMHVAGDPGDVERLAAIVALHDRDGLGRGSAALLHQPRRHATTPASRARFRSACRRAFSGSAGWRRAAGRTACARACIGARHAKQNSAAPITPQEMP
jgi:hypothetical protein